MKVKSKITLSLLACAVLSACGGGGTEPNDDQGAFAAPAAPTIEFIPNSATLPSNRIGYPIEFVSPFMTQARMRVRGDNNLVPISGTIFSMSTANVEVASFASLDIPSTTVREDQFSYVSICDQSNGGEAQFFLQSGAQAGTVILNASVATPFTRGERNGLACTTQLPAGGREFSKQFNYTVTVGPEPFRRTEAVATRLSLPLNPGLAVTNPSSPYVSAVEVTNRTPFGALIDGNNVVISVDRPDLLQLSLADKPETPDTNEFLVLGQEVNTPTRAGKALFYVHSRNVPGSGKVLVRVFDSPTVFSSAELTFTVDAPNDGVSNVTITADARPLYVSGTNGNTSLPGQVRLTNSVGQNVADPTAGSNNVLLEITNPVGESLLVTQGSGASAEGASVRTRTLAGGATFVLRSGARQGIIQVRATADRADNNVDNGIQNAVVAVRPVVISDGRLFDVNLTGAVERVLTQNEIPQATGVSNTAPVTPGTGTPNGSYSLVVSAIGTDRQGNPVLAGQPIEFGMVDSPSTGYPAEGSGRFLITGIDGDPQEAGNSFLAPTGALQTAGAGAGPGDTLLTFGKFSPEIRDLENVRRVTRVNSQTSLDVQNRFNANDDTGVSVDRGPVVPYIVARSTIGTIANNRITNEFGLASTVMTYPISSLNRTVAIWARAEADTPRGQTTPDQASDISIRALAVAAGGTITASPQSITAGVPIVVFACIRDGNNNPIPGALINYAFVGAIGTVDGASTGQFASATGFNGCAGGLVRATLTGTGAGSIALSSFVGTTSVAIAQGARTVLFAIPGALGGNGGGFTLRLLDGTGQPIPGIQIAFDGCTGDASVNLSQPPGATNASGETTAAISAALDGPNSTRSGECRFSALGATATVRLQGVNICNSGFSPAPPGCTTTPVTPAPNRSLQVQVVGPTGGAYGAANPQVQVTANAGGINCVSTTITGPGFPPSCSAAAIPGGTTVQLVATIGVGGVANGAAFCRWTGADTCTGTNPAVSVVMDADKVCVATFSPTGPAGCPTR
jgi:hypothetical protein